MLVSTARRTKAGRKQRTQGECEADGGSAGLGFGVEAGAAAERLGPGGQRLRRGRAPAFGGLEGRRGRAELVEARSVGGRSERRRRGPAEAQDGGGQAQVLVERLRSSLGNPDHGLVGIEAGQQGRAEQVEDRRSRATPDGQPPGGRAPPRRPSP